VLLAGGALLSACGGQTGGAPVVSVSARASAVRVVPNPSAQRPVAVPAGAKCTSDTVDAVIAPGESPTATVWNTAIVITNKDARPCTVQGASKLEFYTGGDGKPLGIKEVTTSGQREDLVTLALGEKAAMTLVVPTAGKSVPADCLEGAAFAEVTLPGDTQPVEAWMIDEALFPPPICGAVQVGPWTKGSAPGVN
jgi:hypothetical protein